MPSNPKSLELIVATTSDHLAAILDLSEEAFGKNQLFTAKQLKSLHQQASNYYFLAYQEEQLVGFVGTTIVLDEMEITAIAVKQTVRQQGVGRQLFESLLQEEVVESIANIFLEVRRQNSQARAYYQALGFEEQAVRKQYYRCPVDDAIILKKEVEKG